MSQKEASDSTKKSCSQYIPGASWVGGLVDKFGLKLIIMLHCTNHLVKGFNYLMLGTCLRFYFQDMNVDGPSIDRYQSIVFMPFAMKPLIGITSDAFPIFGWKKMPYLMFMNVLGITGLCVACFSSLDASSAMLGAISLFFACLQWMACDLFAEAVYSRRMADVPEAGPDLMAFVWGGNQLCGLVANALSGVVISGMGGKLGMTGAQWALALCLIPSSIVIIPTMLNFLGEKRITKEEAAVDRKHLFTAQVEVVFLSLLVGFAAVGYAILSLLADSNTITFIAIWVVMFTCVGSAVFFLRPVIGKLVLFNAIACTTMLSVMGPTQYFFTDDEIQYPNGPHFSPVFFGSVLNTVGTLCAVVAIFVYNKFMKNWRYRHVYMAMIVFMATMQCTNPIVYSRVNLEIGIPDEVFMIGGTALVQASTMLYQMPGFLILSHMCPKNMEATMFALLAALSNFAINVQAPISGYICMLLGVEPKGIEGVDESEQFDNLYIAALICICINLVPLAFLWLIPNVRMTDRVMEEGDNTSATVNSPYDRCTGKSHKKAAAAKEAEMNAEVCVEEEKPMEASAAK